MISLQEVALPHHSICNLDDQIQAWYDARMLRTFLLSLVLVTTSCLSTRDVTTYNSQLLAWYQVDNSLTTRLQLYHAQHQLALLATLAGQKELSSELDSYRARYTLILQDVSQYEMANQASYKSAVAATSDSKLPDLQPLITAAQAESKKVDAFMASEDAHLKTVAVPK
jgi:hypothetical protein